MFKGAYQRKLLTVLYSGGSNPLEIWDIKVKNGWTRRVKDEEMSTIVFEICGTNVATAYICCPPDPRATLGISLPFITMFVKNLKRYFSFEIQILDDKQMRRRFRFSNYQSTTKVRPFACSVPLALKPSWNQLQLNLANFTMRAYGTNYLETQRVQIHANCRIRRVYFSDRLYTEEELPKDYRIFLNVRQAPKLQPAAPEQPPRASFDKITSLEKNPSSTKGPPSILKNSFATKPTDLLEDEATRISFKSVPSGTERSSLRDFTENVMGVRESKSNRSSYSQMGADAASNERTVTFNTGSKVTLTKASLGGADLEGEGIPAQYSETVEFESKTSLRGSVRESSMLEGSLIVQEDNLKTTEYDETEPQEDLTISEGERLLDDGAEHQDRGHEVPGETTDAESAVDAVSEFAESEPIPDSDYEEPPSSPDPGDDSP